jgi:hypothetical protein
VDYVDFVNGRHPGPIASTGSQTNHYGGELIL